MIGRTRPRRAAAMTALVGALLGIVLTGCARQVTGTAKVNQADADRATAETHERGMRAFTRYFADLGDERARVYNYVNYAGRKLTNEFESFKFGDPVTLLETKRRDSTDDTMAILHPPGSELDYVRLDRKHAHLAPTPWVAMPTRHPQQFQFQSCLILTAWVACHLNEAIEQTTREARDRMPRQVRALPDGGVEVVTGVTLGSMLDEGIASVRAELKDTVPQTMRSTMIPVTITFDSAWAFTGFDVRATVAGQPSQLDIQIGYEVAGTATKADFPQQPQPNEVTSITDKAAASAFWEELASNPDES
jgi:hypothetical protein